ncbi:MAG TPA: response regulator [Polyangiaceae bacterium]|nr:response regulator [Polyangiaceae bacterium]
MAQDPFKYFRVEAHELLEQFGKGALDLEKGQNSAETVHKLLRVAHTLKGAARVVKQTAIADHSHGIEELLQPYREAATRVPQATIAALLQRLEGIRAALAALAAPPPEHPGAPAAAAALPAPAEEELRTLRADVRELDELLEGINETRAQLRAVQNSAAGIQRARQLTEQLLEQLNRQSGRDGARATGVEKWASLAGELQASVSALAQKLGSGLEQVQRELSQVRGAAEQLRLVPVSSLFTSLERSARDSAQALEKQVTFTAQGGDVRLDAHVLEVARAALMQLIRNAVAHGIESPAERRAAGKPPSGKISLEISRRSRRVRFRCSDDGRGIDLDAVRRTLQQRGMPEPELGRLGREELLRSLLRGGISTAARVSQVAGRGIGLDLARSAAERLGGQIRVDTESGRGTSFELVLPLSVASLEALVVEAEGTIASIPLDSVRRTLRVPNDQVSHTERGPTLLHEGRAIPFVPLALALRARSGPEPLRTQVWSVLVIDAGGLAAVGVDRLLDTETIVLRPLPQYAPAEPIVAGASLDADGNPRLVLDPEQLVAEAGRGRFAEQAARAERRSILVIDDSLTTRMLEQSILESAGYTVDTASSAEEGLLRARQQRYALFLVDVEMPGMDGFGFVQRTRADPELSKVPAILVTSLSAPEHLQRGKDVGASGYVIKSEFDQADLLERIRKLVE